VPDVKKRYDQYIRANGGKRKAEQQAKLWLKNVISDKADNSINEISRYNLFIPGKMYIFDYDAKTYLDPLPYFDSKPTIISLGINRNVKPLIEVGLNLNYLPENIKEKVLDKIADFYSSSINENIKGRNSEDATRQPGLSIDYSKIKPIIDYYYLGFAIKNYIPGRKTNVRVISYENWYKALLIEQDGFIGATDVKVHRDYGVYIKDKIKRKK
jgi:hypothetical protein